MSCLEELLNNSEKYRSGPNYKATNIVFPAEFSGQRYIIKKARALASLINAYYTFQDKFFYGTRELSTSKQRFAREADKLTTLDGLHSPKLAAYNNSTIIREWLRGRDFRNIACKQEKKRTLKESFKALERIHKRGVVIGDAHVKNIFLGDNRIPYWIDFDGAFDESDSTKAKALDLLKFVYSTYTTTREKDLICYSAEIISEYSNKEVRETVRELSLGRSEIRLWFPTRIPIDGTLKVVHAILQAYL